MEEYVQKDASLPVLLDR